MKKTLSIASAMTLRKRINAKITEIADAMDNIQAFVYEDKLEETKKILVTGSVKSDIELMNELAEDVAQISSLITKNNEIGAMLVSHLQNIDREIRLLKRLKPSNCNLLRMNEGRERNPVTGEVEVRKMVSIADLDLNSTIDALNLKKARLEDELSEYNASTKIEVDLSDKTYELIYGRKDQ
jgi:hypothetical protein